MAAPPPDPVRLNFPQLTPDLTFQPHDTFSGKIVSTRSYNPGTLLATFTLTPLVLPEGVPKTEMEVQLKGQWADKASREFSAGRGVVLTLAHGPKILKRKGKNGQVSVDEAGWSTFKVEYSAGIAGKWVSEKGKFDEDTDDSEDEQDASKSTFEFLGPKATSSKAGRPAVNKAPSAAVATTSAAKGVSPAAQVASALPQPIRGPAVGPTAPSVPQKRPADPEPAPAPAAQSAPKAGSRSSKRRRKEERKVWGLTVEDKGVKTVYPALGSFDQTKSQREVNLIGTVFVVSPAAKAQKSGDWYMGLGLFDPTHTDFLRITVFAAKESHFPPCESGDVLICRGLNWSKDHKNFTCYKSKVRFGVLKKDSLLNDTSIISPPLLRMNGPAGSIASSEAEVDYARDVAKATQRLKAPTTPLEEEEEPVDIIAKSRLLSKGGTGGRQLQEVKDMSEGIFCDAVLEIFRIFENGNNMSRMHENDSVIVYATDYTTNSELFHYDEKSFGKGPAGQQTLQISVFGKQTESLRKVGQNQSALAHFKNLRIKLNEHGLMEATMIQDPKFPDKRDIYIIDMSPKGVSASWPEQVNALIRRRNASSGPIVEALGKMDAQTAPTVEGASNDDCVDRATSEEVSSSRLGHITCDKVDSPTQAICDVLEGGSAGVYHLKARIVDYYPSRLQDWVLAFCDECGERLPDGTIQCLEHGKSPLTLRLHFFLALSDHSLVDGQPCDLRVEFDESATSPIFPGFTPTLAMRAGDEVALDVLCARLNPLLGNLECAKRRKRQQPEEKDFGPTFDVSVQMSVTEGADGSRLPHCVVGRGMRFNKP